MLKKIKVIPGGLSALSNGFQRNKTSVVSWNYLPDETSFGCMDQENDKMENRFYLWCHLMSKPLNAEKTQYQFRVLPVIYRLSKVKKSVSIYGGYFYVVNLNQPVEWDDFEKVVNKKDLLIIIRHALINFHNDHQELKNDQEELKDISFSLPTDKELIKCIDHKRKNRPWEFKCGK